MNFASALFSLQRGHKIKRHHWTGYWYLKSGEVIMHTYKGADINLRNTTDILYTLENIACDDWEIYDEDHATKELDFYDSNEEETEESDYYDEKRETLDNFVNRIINVDNPDSVMSKYRKDIKNQCYELLNPKYKVVYSPMSDCVNAVELGFNDINYAYRFVSSIMKSNISFYSLNIFDNKGNVIWRKGDKLS